MSNECSKKTWVVTVETAEFVLAKHLQVSSYKVPRALRLELVAIDEDDVFPQEVYLRTGPGWKIQGKGTVVNARNLGAFDKDSDIGSWLKRLDFSCSTAGTSSPRFAGWWTNRSFAVTLGDDGEVLPLRCVEVAAAPLWNVADERPEIVNPLLSPLELVTWLHSELGKYLKAIKQEATNEAAEANLPNA